MKRYLEIFSKLIMITCFMAGATSFIIDSVSHKKPARLFSLNTDYFRSRTSGNWGATATWDSSPDAVTWSLATLTPTSAANTISIRNTHTVIIVASQNMDQVVIESGGILNYTGGTLTVNDGAGDDIIVNAGGILALSVDGIEPVFSPATATARMSGGGMLRLNATGLTFPGSGVNASNYIYQDASILEYTPNLAFASSGVTFFPNVDAFTIPVFRTTGNLGLIGGGLGSDTRINGLYEANGTITFNNAGQKIFRNGIVGTGVISSTANCGKFVINGLSSTLGGPASLTVPPVNGMEIGSGTQLTMVSDKTVFNNTNLLANTYLFLNNFNLTLNGTISGGALNAHVVTGGTGRLVINNIGATPITFPIGPTSGTYNPLIISNGGNVNYGARVSVGITPTIQAPLRAVNRTWYVRPATLPPGTVNVSYNYLPGDGNASFNYASNVEVGLYSGAAWNLINYNLTPNGTYKVDGTVNNFAAATEAPLIVANLGAILAAPVSVHLTARKENNQVQLNWSVVNISSTTQFILEKSTDGISFYSLKAGAETSFEDQSPQNNFNYYRVRMNLPDGREIFSNTVLIKMANAKTRLVRVIQQTVGNGILQVGYEALENTSGQILVNDAQGRLLFSAKVFLLKGSNELKLTVQKLPPGIYFASLINDKNESSVLKFVVQ